jgi:hypothetical protein
VSYATDYLISLFVVVLAYFNIQVKVKMFNHHIPPSFLEGLGTRTTTTVMNKYIRKMSVAYDTDAFCVIWNGNSRKYFGFIPDIIEILYHYELSDYLVEYLLEGTFRSKQLWKSILGTRTTTTVMNKYIRKMSVAYDTDAFCVIWNVSHKFRNTYSKGVSVQSSCGNLSFMVP